jgi:hypothetical protein
MKRVFHAGHRGTDGPGGETLRHPPGRAYVNEYPPSTRESYRRAMEGRSRKAAIRAFCVMCMGYQPHHVRGCTAPWCPLYPYRLGVVDGGKGDVVQRDSTGDKDEVAVP